MCFSSRSASDRQKTDKLREKFRVAVFPLWILLQNPYEKGPNKKVVTFSLHSYRRRIRTWVARISTILSVHRVRGKEWP